MAGDVTSQMKGEQIKSLKAEMTEWQKRTLYYVWDIPRFIHTITGLPETDKSIFIALISRMLNILDYKVLLLASSNVEVDAVMEKTKKYDAENKAIRSHSLQTENSLTKKASGQAKRNLRLVGIPHTNSRKDFLGPSALNTKFTYVILWYLWNLLKWLDSNNVILRRDEIGILCPYNGQVQAYTEILKDLSYFPAWQGLRLEKIRILTINSAQGLEFNLVPLD